ncbi:MAG: hypothetical protein RMK91_01705 [Pseudanabaenaceae cyanobacterium SKYGB_i_bin29]|nr:hypothetical protein [Pseudanabaenaceae cyanobacterium SKYG29]MDW8420564.1 hypothetical protein [Pseudanabaenaceae cyanobacterium SKYGB_i_bin29]
MDFSWGKKLSRRLQQWYQSRPAKAIEDAYRAALQIQQLEMEYFRGEPIRDDGTYGSGTYTVIQAQLQKYLNVIRIKLWEYKLVNLAPGNWQQNVLLGEKADSAPTILAKLELIDKYLERYGNQTTRTEVSAVVGENSTAVKPSPIKRQIFNQGRERATSIVPDSLVFTFKQIAGLLSGSASQFEQEVVDEIEQTRRRTFIAIRFFVSLIALAIVVQWGSKTLIYSPLVDRWYQPQTVAIKFQDHFKTEALEEFRSVQEEIELESLVAALQGKPIDRDTQEEKLKKAAEKLVIDYNYRSIEGIKNLLADLTSAAVVYGIIIFGRREVRIVKEFIYETLAGLSDSAKAFLIIVSTDTFVGYHSSDGWDALIKVLFHHFGLPENVILTDIFIATVPVFLDALFKFWIFQYLRRASPPTSAIYREMND